MAILYTFEPPETAPLDPGEKKSRKPKVLMADFGDGYSQRAAEGPNNDPETRSLSWTHLDTEEKTYIDDFFKARNGWESFYYQAEDDETQKVYICQEWDVQRVAYDIYTVTATLRQVYDLG